MHLRFKLLILRPSGPPTHEVQRSRSDAGHRRPGGFQSMMSRTIHAAVFFLVALAALSCSKTQDTPPGRRVFGDPPKILSVDPLPPDLTKHAHCEFTEIIRSYYCTFNIRNVQFQAGGGWAPPRSPHDGIPDSTVPGVFIEGDYDQVVLRGKGTDPNPPPPPRQSQY